MKVIIAGSRDIKDYQLLKMAIQKSELDITEVVSGGAAGVDFLGERWAREHGVLLTRFPADWSAYGKAAGPIRNGEMAAYVGKEGALLALWDGKSKGTKNMIDQAEKHGLKFYVVISEGKV